MKKLSVGFDIDQVLCLSWRPEFAEQFANRDFTEFERDIPTYPSAEWAVVVLQALADKSIHIVFITARNEEYKSQTIEWIAEHTDLKRSQYSLYMRPKDNTDSDYILKLSLYKKMKPKYNLLCCFDDNIKNAELWRDLGINSLHVLNPK